MMPLADLAQQAIAGKNRVAGRRRIVVGESIILAGDDGDGHGALQVSAGRAAAAVLPCPQARPRPIARFAERRSGCGPQFRHRTPEGAQGLTTENCTRAALPSVRVIEPCRDGPVDSPPWKRHLRLGISLVAGETVARSTDTRRTRCNRTCRAFSLVVAH